MDTEKVDSEKGGEVRKQIANPRSLTSSGPSDQHFETWSQFRVAMKEWASTLIPDRVLSIHSEPRAKGLADGQFKYKLFCTSFDQCPRQLSQYRPRGTPSPESDWHAFVWYDVNTGILEKEWTPVDRHGDFGLNVSHVWPGAAKVKQTEAPSVASVEAHASAQSTSSVPGVAPADAPKTSGHETHFVRDSDEFLQAFHKLKDVGAQFRFPRSQTKLQRSQMEHVAKELEGVFPCLDLKSRMGHAEILQ